ncbi:MAG: cellulase family glycosylhydrolase [bacterium]|nr:cellulase family glycosylhydrolase [bacterium]
MQKSIIYRNVKLLGILLILALVALLFLTLPSGLPSLYTKGNKILSASTNQPITLRGIVSDYFRYDFNYDYPELYGGLEAELAKIKYLKQAGADVNVVGLYLARLDKIKSHIEEMDQYIEYARDNDMYVYLAPAGIGFLETNPEKKIKKDEGYWENVGANDLGALTEFLASRYGSYSNVMYQLTAEPNISYSTWEIKQRELAEIVRKYTNNPIIVSTPRYTPYSSLPALPFENIIYSTGGYVRRVDGSFTERQISDILGIESLKRIYPVMVAEFGGNYGGDFSSVEDLLSFKNIMEALHQEQLSYSVYRLSATYQGDGLALFDTEGNLTKKGQIFLNMFVSY